MQRKRKIYTVDVAPIECATEEAAKALADSLKIFLKKWKKDSRVEVSTWE